MKLDIQIKLFFVLMVLSFPMISCGDDKANQEAHEETEVEKHSNADTTEVVVETNKTDVLTFVGIDDNYDYWYAYFESENGLETFVYGPNVKLDNDLVGSELSVVWEVDTLYEAGEDDQPYEQKRILSIEVVKKAPTFLEFMDAFAKVYGDTLQNIDDFKSDQVPYNKAWNPGVACFLGANPPHFFQFVDKGKTQVVATLPEGGFCDGYEGVKDGFYFENGTPPMPTYAQLDDDDNFVEVTASLPDRYRFNAVRKVLVIQGGWQYAYLYFVWVDGGWKLWIEDLCNCSA